MKNLNIHLYLRKKYFYSSLRDGRHDRGNGYKTYGIYLTLIYLKIFITIILLLAGVFEKFIFTYLKYYGLDPCHYFSAPGLSLDAMLKMSEVELEKISDPDKYMFFRD